MQTSDVHGDTRFRQPAVLGWMRLVRVYHKVAHALTDHLRCKGLSMAQFDVLAHVGAAEGRTQQELADSLLVSKGNVCQLLDRMQEAGLISRRQEGRANRLFLTDTGRRVYEDVVPSLQAMISAQFTSLTSEQQGQLLGILRTMDRALED